MAVNYNDGNWHGWNGGECPVHPETVVVVKWACNGVETNEYPAKYVGSNWDGVCAFRVIKEHHEPREFWVTKQTLFDLNGNVSGYEYHQANEEYGEFKVREVM